MKEVSSALRGWIDLVEKALLIVTLIIGILTATWKGAEFINAKAGQVDAEKREVVQRTQAIDLMTSTYTALLNQLDKDIKGLDEKMSAEIWKNSTGWDKFAAIREERAKDRNALLHSLGDQIVQLKQAEK